MITQLAWLWTIEPLGMAILTACILALIIYPMRWKIRYLIGGAWLLALWVVANVWHEIKMDSWRPNRSEIRKVKYEIGCKELAMQKTPRKASL